MANSVGVAVSKNTVSMGIHTRQKHGSVWAAHRSVADGPGKNETLPGKGVEVGGNNRVLTREAHGVLSHFIGKDKYKIGSL